MFQFPSLNDRKTLIGRTGSGKTQAGAWLLSESPFDRQPFVILDYKREPLFDQIARRKEISLREVPNKPGLYHLKLLPGEDDDALEKWLWKVWRQGSTGLFFDEGYLVPKNSAAWRSILVTGRSLRLPTFTLSQRPVSLPIWSISEADYYYVFHLNRKEDWDKVAGFVPQNENIWAENVRLPKFHSRWYDVGADQSLVLGPAPQAAHILGRFDERLKPRKRII